jgi:hypothetical protein
MKIPNQEFKNEKGQFIKGKRPKWIGRKISEAKKGKPSGRKGQKLSEEHKKNISLAHSKRGLSWYKKCIVCSKEFKVYKFNNKITHCCSQKCASLNKWTLEKRIEASNRMKGHIPWNKGIKGYLAGKKHYRWKTGLTLSTGLLNKIRICPQYKKWSSEVLERDNYTCQNCSIRGGKLESHHKEGDEFSAILLRNNIKTFEEAIKCKELWDIKNGKTLCLKCHNLTKLGRNNGRK